MFAKGPRIGILGGTFDPVHLGHIASAKDVAKAFQLERVLLVPAATPPHKNGAEVTPAPLRWKMVELAIKEAARGQENGVVLEACDIEMQRTGPSWTVDTLHELRRRLPGAHLHLILGRDAYEAIETWSRPEQLLTLASVIVTSRPGHDSATHCPLPPVAARDHARYDPAIGAFVHNSGYSLHSHRILGLEASATDIRRRVQRGLPIDDLTGAAVARFIDEHRLYRDAPADAPHGRPDPS